VLYVAGTRAGTREGYAMPDRIVRATDRRIHLPALTGNPNDPLSDIGPVSYRLQPGLKEQHESAQEQLEQARTTWSNVEQTARKRVLPEATVSYARTKLDEAEKAFKNAAKRRDEGKRAGRSDESWIDLEASAGAGKAFRGIYRLRSDILMICYAEADWGRPETFAADQPTEILVILRRGGVESVLAAVPGRRSETVPGTKDTVSGPRLKLTITGDAKRFTGTIANYTITMENPGTGVVHNVRGVATVPRNGRPVGPGWSDSRLDSSTGRIDWVAPQLEPGQKIILPLQIRMDVPGIYEVAVEALCDEGPSSKSLCKTDVSLADREFEVREERRVVDVDDFNTFTIRIKNIDTKDATHILVRAVLSKNITPDSVSGNDGKPVQAVWNEAERCMAIPGIDRLGVGEESVLRIKVKANAGGMGTCRVYLMQDGQDEPLEDMAAFKITAPR
jgi:hypothetical protein